MRATALLILGLLQLCEILKRHATDDPCVVQQAKHELIASTSHEALLGFHGLVHLPSMQQWHLQASFVLDDLKGYVKGNSLCPIEPSMNSSTVQSGGLIHDTQILKCLLCAA